ncbi:sulfite oxidase : Putative sulfite oxidase OS=Microbacterium oleivorans GN=BW34_00024 PE=4 SV=1: Oxidored_molyb [Gemmata massiliana]|uniref:Oxidoreductase molybdopterin-binding domain-containing protein n=1 Tax=Gemmata massiliana TaxID=1210884 RepID=A0A6P2D4E0_9BACT|nr:molybdopterin-dependent oxidoreductase [Gemmata massiliana]VTR95943.1 sulfite oxidase : Putative sulfite oxidase OS=Microbacterium oleivorans GN=BW34_00024 PE=4 SV=1: Oxidored_molyb [Gemmata massiliana]
MSEARDYLDEHHDLTRRFFLRCGATLAAGTAVTARGGAADPLPPELSPVLEKLESYFTAPSKFEDVSRGRPIPHTLPVDKKKEVGLTRETWRLEIVTDPENPAKLGKQFTKKDNTALDFDTLVKLGEKHAVRFPKIMTCLNLGCPLGMGIWEGVPLRTLVWLAQPKENLRRVFYYGYHNDDPKQQFRSSLPVGRVLEDFDDLPPVIACYKLNGEWLTPERGAPVRVVAPEHYGYKSVKWLTHLVLSNLAHANDTYGAQNNDIDSPMKTFAATLHVPANAKANAPLPITGYAQAGISGLSKVQVWVSPVGKGWNADDPYFTTAPWSDATVLAPPKKWGGNLLNDAIPKGTIGFDAAGQPKSWPMRLAKAHWAAVLPGLPAGQYTLRCRTIDAKGQAQPMPRPFKKSGRCDIEAVNFTVIA